MNIRENLLFRKQLLEKCERDEEYKGWIIEKCNRDIVFLANNFLYTYDPRQELKILPFMLYPFQVKMINELDLAVTNQDSLLVEKTRDMGFSWTFLAWALFKMRSVKGFSVGVGSRKAQLVDDLGNMKSLIHRFRWMLRKIPPWLIPGYDEKKHSKHMFIQLPHMESSMSGEAGDDIGRGDRTSVYLLDEFAHIPRSSMVQEAISQTTNVRIYGSTPKGRGNEFARLRWKTDIRRLTLHWRDHPNKDQAWYDKQAETMTEEQIAQELDISYNKSVEGKVYKWFECEQHGKDLQEYNPNYPVYLTFDWGINDPTACLFLQDYNGIIRIFDAFERRDTEISGIIVLLINKLRNYGLTLKDISGWYGDPDARNRHLTGPTIAQYFWDRYKIKFRFKLPNRIGQRIMSVRMMGKSNRILVDNRLTHVIDCFENYRYPEKEHGENEKPLHDWACHTPSALEYYTVYEHGMDEFKSTPLITTTRMR